MYVRKFKRRQKRLNKALDKTGGSGIIETSKAMNIVIFGHQRLEIGVKAVKDDNDYKKLSWKKRGCVNGRRKNYRQTSQRRKSSL